MNTYPPDWPEISRETKEEVGWRCVRCGHPDHPLTCEAEGVHRGYAACDEACEHEPDHRKRVLTVHHLDGDKANVRRWNLAALCQVCHLEIQGKVRMEQTYWWPHSEWFRPYVAGFYAWTVLGEDLERDEVVERMDELLEAGQPWLREAVT